MGKSNGWDQLHLVRKENHDEKDDVRIDERRGSERVSAATKIKSAQNSTQLCQKLNTNLASNLARFSPGW